MNMEHIKLQKIEEVDCDRDTDRVNEYLSKGWVLLKIRLITRVEGSDTTEYPVYILGLPSE